MILSGFLCMREVHNTVARPLPGFPSIRLYGLELAQVSTDELVDHLFASLARGQGGWLVTANLDFLCRHRRDPGARALYDRADLRVADGMPLLWAARLQGDRLPERVAGSSLLPLIAARAAATGRSLYLLGGTARGNEGAADVLRARWPELRLAGNSSPQISDPPDAPQLRALAEQLERARPDVLLVGMGSPKQERVIEALRPALPATWMIGVGASFSFVAGELRRAPPFMQRAGLEWVHRLAQEPRRLGRRYLADDLPFAARLFGHSARRRLASNTTAVITRMGTMGRMGTMTRTEATTNTTTVTTMASDAAPAERPPGLLTCLREDFAAHARDWSRPGFQALAVYRFGVWRMGVRPRLLRAPLSVVYRTLFRAVRNFYGIELPYSASVGRRVVFEHQHGIVVHGDAVIGDDCVIRQGVTLGMRDVARAREAPVLGQGVNVGAGAKILGRVRVGDRADIGANAVVLEDVPAGALAVGVPARVVSRKRPGAPGGG
jgi:N-acetylglucosaminyldiphosphoundecaprenol N-acetyl-beta-D-mannosaminyltransferase